MTDEEKKGNDEEADLSHPWKQVQTAVWLIGIAILAWQDWWWPGILVLVAISGLTEAAMRQYTARQTQDASTRQRHEELAQKRAAITPDVCPSCGSPVTAESVDWTGPSTAACPYCGSIVTNNDKVAG